MKHPTQRSIKQKSLRLKQEEIITISSRAKTTKKVDAIFDFKVAKKKSEKKTTDRKKNNKKYFN